MGKLLEFKPKVKVESIEPTDPPPVPVDLAKEIRNSFSDEDIAGILGELNSLLDEEEKDEMLEAPTLQGDS